MKWKGKLIGLLLGLLVARFLRTPWALVIGLVLGHLFDAGVLGGKPAAQGTPAPPPALDPYTALGIASNASDDELEQAYRRLMSEYHPDRVANAASEIREIADRRTREINQAYDQIKRQRGL